MYPVSNDFKNKMKDPQRVEHIRGYVGGVSFTDNNIMSLSYSNRCSDTKDVTFGSAYIGELDVSFIGISITRGQWRGKIITLEYGLELDDEHTTEWIPIGSFEIASAEWTDTGINTVAYDILSKFDGSAQITTTSGQVYNYFNYLCSSLGLTFGRTALECQSLPNGNETLILSGANISTNRDLISYLGAAVGGFVTADRDGNLTVRSWAESDVVDILRAQDRIIGSVFSDYSTDYAGISIVDAENGATLIYGSGDGAIIALGDNPLLQTGIDTTKDRQRNALATVAQGIAYTPFNISLLNCPVYDLGDLIECKDGVAGSGTLTCCVMSIEWQFKNTIALQGYGADPNLSAGKTKAERAISNMSKDKNKEGIIYHPYSNVSPIVITTTPTKLFEYDFLATEQTSVMLEYNLKMLNEFTDENQTVTLYYYVNGEKVSYEPMDTYSESDEYHIYPGFYWLLNLLGGSETVFEVWAETDNGTAFINAGDIHAMLWGQKLYAQQGGQIPDLSDEYELTPMPNPIPIGLEESEVDLDTDYHPTPIGDYLDLENGTYLELEGGGYMELESGGN